MIVANLVRAWCRIEYCRVHFIAAGNGTVDRGATSIDPDRDAPATQSIAAGTSEDVVTVMNAWVRAAPPSVAMHAGHMTLTFESGRTQTVLVQVAAK